MDGLQDPIIAFCRKAIVHLYIVVLLLLTTACGGIRLAPKPVISEQEAIKLAEQIAVTDDLHFVGTREKPFNIQAELSTLSEASTALQAKGLAFGYDASAYPDSHAVWVVTMEGSWARDFPPLELGEPTREPYRRLAVILDATSGARIALAVP